ncbi:MAG: DUF1080 domain-containing protein [Opitutales bacterium]
MPLRKRPFIFALLLALPCLSAFAVEPAAAPASQPCPAAAKACADSTAAPCAKATRALFNGVNLDGWYTYLDGAGYEDPERNFRVEDGVLHIIGTGTGYVATKESFSDYHLKVVFKWGEMRYPPREALPRDSGIQFHFALGEADKVWPHSIECQVQEHDCGDVWCIGTTLDSPNLRDPDPNLSAMHVLRSEDFENPLGQWNTMEIVARGNRFEFYVNGHLVNSGTNADVHEGRIVLQSEAAEIFYKSVEITPL